MATNGNGNRLMRKRKFVALILCWAGLTILTCIAVIRTAEPVEVLRVYANTLPWLLGVYGVANVGAKFAQTKNGGQTP